VSFWQSYYHLVWTTRHRAPTIDGRRAAVIDRAIRATGREDGVIVHAVGSVPDHRHMVVSIPPRLAVSAVVQRLKGTTSHLLNHAEAKDGEGPFAWQTEYGVLTFAKESLPTVVAYVQNQTAHHAANDLWPLYECDDRRHAPVLSLGEASST